MILLAVAGGIAACMSILGGLFRVLVVLGRVAQQHRELQALVPIVADIQKVQAIQGLQLRKLRRRVRRRLNPERATPCQSKSPRSR